jgi:hypothetical protein
MEEFQIPTLLKRIKQFGNRFAAFFEAKKEQNFEQVLQFLRTK